MDHIVARHVVWDRPRTSAHEKTQKQIEVQIKSLTVPFFVRWKTILGHFRVLVPAESLRVSVAQIESSSIPKVRSEGSAPKPGPNRIQNVFHGFRSTPCPDVLALLESKMFLGQ